MVSILEIRWHFSNVGMLLNYDYELHALYYMNGINKRFLSKFLFINY